MNSRSYLVPPASGMCALSCSWEPSALKTHVSVFLSLSKSCLVLTVSIIALLCPTRLNGFVPSTRRQLVLEVHIQVMVATLTDQWTRADWPSECQAADTATKQV